MSMTLREIQGMTSDWTDLGREAAVLADLWDTSESEALRAWTQVICRYRALELSKEVEVAFNAAQVELERLAEARDRARAETRAIRADLEAAEKELEAVGRPGQAGDRERELSQEKSRVSKLSRAYREAGKAAQGTSREYWRAEKRVDGMKKVLTALRSVARPDPAIMRALAEALADAGER